MYTQIVRRISSVVVITLFLAGSLYSSPPAPVVERPVTSAENWYFIDRSTTLLRELRSLAGQLKSDTETLDQFNRQPSINWQSHVHYLTQVKTNINEAGNVLRELQGMRHAVRPWQQQAIDRIHPVAVEVAEHTQAAIKHLNENQGRILTSEYKDRLSSLADSAAEMKQHIDNFLNYADTKQKLEGIQSRLQVENL